MSEPNIHAVSAKVDIVLKNLERIENKLDDKVGKRSFNKLEKKVDRNQYSIWKLSAIVGTIATGLSAVAQKAIALIQGIIPH